MTDEPVRTEVRTDDGWLEFQDYFVHRHQEPDGPRGPVRGIAAAARPTPEVRRRARRRRGPIVIAPSNPIVSVGPILAVARHARGARQRARQRGVRSSRCRGSSAARPSRDRPTGCSPRSATRSSALGVARLYAGLVDGFVLDRVDADLAPAIEALGLRTLVTDTIMTDDAARARLAAEMLAFADGRLPAARADRAGTTDRSGYDVDVSPTHPAPTCRGSSRSCRSARSRAQRRGSAERSTPRSARRSSCGCSIGRSVAAEAVDAIGSVVVVSPDPAVLRAGQRVPGPRRSARPARA